MRNGILLLLLLTACMASAEPDHLTYPGRITICGDANDCITVVKREAGWVGLIDGGAKPAWNFQIDDFRLEHLKLTGTSIEPDAKGRYQSVIVQGKPEIIQYWITHCKARYAVGHTSTSRKVTVTWEPPPFKDRRVVR